MSLRSVEESWERFGRSDPYFGVLNAPRFRAAATPGPARRAFFESGEVHIERLFTSIRDSLAPDFTPRHALDFGCGVGRTLLPLARRVPEVVGVDISPSMLREARRNLEEAGFSNCRLILTNELSAGNAQRFDLIHSYIVFQHIPRRQGMALVRTLLSFLEDEGIGALHFVYAARLPRWRQALHGVRKHVPLAHSLFNLLQGRPASSPLMQMNLYDLNDIFAVLEEQRCHRAAVRFSDHGGWLGVLLMFQRQEQLDQRIT